MSNGKRFLGLIFH